MRKKILIVNCYFDDLRMPVKRRMKVPQAIGPAYLAGAFSETRCHIRLFNEQFSGPLEDETLLAFPDMLVLTGLTTAFDRMLHLAAYARTKNPMVIVVAGGPAIRALPEYSEHFFDICCTGDIEQLKDVIADTFGMAYVSRTLLENGWALPRYDLVDWIKLGGYVESSRNCYYNCSFCSIAAEGGMYRPYDVEYLRRQFIALGRKKQVLFVDNNFGSTNRHFLEARFELLRDLKDRGYFRHWVAMASEEFLTSDNITKCREAGCFGLFSGVESFSERAILHFRKYQNSRLPQVETIRRCLDAGLVFTYGLMFDVSVRKLADLRNELDFILDTPEIPLPSYISIAVPMLKTPHFYNCISDGRLLPDIKMRDLDGTTLSVKPLDSMDEVVEFIRRMRNLSGYRRKVLRHTREFYRLYGKNFRWSETPFALSSPLLLCTSRLSTLGSDYLVHGWKRRYRTHVGTTETPDSVYKPAFRVDSRYSHYFRPTLLTDARGHINEALLPDIFPAVCTGKIANRAC